MTKEEYVVEILSDSLTDIAEGRLLEVAKGIVDGLDMWGEYSGDNVATSNRYADIEREKTEAIQKAERKLVEEENRHLKELQELQRNARWSIQRKQERIEELEKQIK